MQPIARPSICRRANRAPVAACLRPALGLLSLCTASLLCSCGGPSVRDKPAWIDQPPYDDDNLYAVGSFVGSLDPNDNYKNAIKDAARALARAFKTQVSSDVVLRRRNTSTRLDERTRSMTDTLLQQMEHVATWVDVEGAYSQRHTVWVLVRAAKTLNL